MLQRKKANSQRLDDHRRWSAVFARDKAFDGHFFYSVATTGVYCRPSCPSRPARREHVRFHASCAEAEAKGFRPCKRCRPNEPSDAERRAQIVAKACRLIETAEDEPSLDVLARASGLSRFHFHRLFKLVTGITPKAYAGAHRQELMRRKLPSRKSVTEVIYEAGFKSSSRFYAGAGKALGMTPTDFRTGGRNVELRFAVGLSSIGSVLVAASDKGIAAILLGEKPEHLLRELRERFPKAGLVGGDRSFQETISRVLALVEMPAASLDLPLDIRGTAFQCRVWQALSEIPAGSTATYSEIAKRIGADNSVRAVARACATNVHAIVIPCHRVVRADGSISGYRWGVERKRVLLEREASAMRTAARKKKGGS